MPNILERLWNKIDRSAGPKGCWPWVASWTGKGGYGKLKVRGRSIFAHRLVWQLIHGPIKTKLEVCHSCDNPGCCNPSHLWLGTHKQNMMDMGSKGRQTPKLQNGELNSSVKLNNKKVRAIRSLIKKGIQQQKIAALYGVSGATICLISKRKLWAHL